MSRGVDINRLQDIIKDVRGRYIDERKGWSFIVYPLKSGESEDSECIGYCINNPSTHHALNIIINAAGTVSAILGDMHGCMSDDDSVERLIENFVFRMC